MTQGQDTPEKDITNDDEEIAEWDCPECPYCETRFNWEIDDINHAHQCLWCGELFV